MANTISGFFKQNAEERALHKVAISKRFKDNKGEALKWTLRPVTSKRMEVLRKASRDENGRTDNEKLGMKLIVECVVEPPLDNAELQDSYGVKAAEDLVYEMLYADELDHLMDEVLRLNGYKESQDELVEQAKN